MTITILTGDCRDVLPTLEAGSVQCCVTSPPYWGLRDYGHERQIGLERAPDEYVAALVGVFREVRRVLADDGTLWLNLGDCYAQQGGPGWQGKNGQRADRRFTAHRDTVPMREIGRSPACGLKPKDLVGIPWRVAFALQADGWYLRSDIIWAKPNPMPESVTDRPTKAHEYIFLLSKSERYYYDAKAIAEPAIHAGRIVEYDGSQKACGADGDRQRTQIGGPGGSKRIEVGGTRNRRTVWTVATQPYAGAHFATMPPALVEPCILAGSRPGDIVLDPFGGSGTTGMVAQRLGRRATIVEINPAYVTLADERTAGTMGLAL